MPWLFRFFSRWPLPVLHAIGAGLGWLVWLASAQYRRQFRANVAQAGLPFSAARPAIAEAGRFVGELPWLWMRPPGASCMGSVRLAGQEHANQAFATGRGVIFFGPHCGSFELGPQALAELYGPVTAIYRPARLAWLARLESLARNRPPLAVVPAGLGGIRLMHKALKTNQAVAMLTDQVPPEGWGVWAPFFGRPAYTMTLAARLALQTGATLLPVSCERLPRGRGYILQIWPAVASLQPSARPGADDNAGDRTKNVGSTDADRLLPLVVCINQAIEAIVRSQPGQYLWGYARYKAPRGDAV